MKDRIDLAKHFHDKGFKKGAEIGVADGRYSKILCESIHDLHLICVDPWQPYEGNWRTQDYQAKALSQAEEKLLGYDVEFMVATSLEAAPLIEDDSLDFVFIDGAHDFDNVMLDIILWTPKVRKGGIISGHDYCFFTNSGVVEAVNTYTEIHHKELNIISRAKDVHRDDRQPCWWFVR